MAVNPLDHEELYDSVQLGNVRSPGVVKISGHDRKVKWDIKKAKGQKGASMSRDTEDPIEFLTEYELTDREDFDAWPAYLEVVNSTVAGPTPKALDIYHPDLLEVGIKSVVLSTVVGTKHNGKGGQIKGIRFTQYFPPKPAGGSPSGSKSKTAKKDDPNADLKAEVARLTQEYQRSAPTEQAQFWTGR